MADVRDLLGLAIDSNPVEFTDTLNDILQDKALEAVAAKRVDVAQSMYDGPDETQDEDEQDMPLPEDDDEYDLDLDNLDLDDLDLTDLDNDEEE
jgi:hypothetical protein